MRQKRKVISHAAAAAAILTAALTAGVAVRAHEGMAPGHSMSNMADMPARQAMPGMSIYHLDSDWTMQSGKVTKLGSLRGTPVLAAMIYTHCVDVCPLITEKMRQIDGALPKGLQNKLKLVLFSMDWKRDDPLQLRIFASQHRLDLQQWTLFHGDENAVRELAAVLGVNFYRSANGDFQHSIAIFLLNSDGVVAAQQIDLNKSPSEMVTAIRHLLVGHR